MDNKTDAKIRSKQDRYPRPKRIVERFDFETGVWHRVELQNDDEIENMSPDTRTAYIDIVTTISDTIITGTNPKIGN